MREENINNENVRDLMDRFMAGETTCAQEQMLYEYFSRKELPKEMEQYRTMMQWYAAGMPDDISSITSHRRGVMSHLRWWHYASIAASLMVLSMMCAKFIDSQSQPQEYAIYEGSYIVRDGVKITDLDIIMPEIKQAEAYVESIHHPVFSTDEMLTECVIRGIEDKQTQEMVRNVIFENKE